MDLNITAPVNQLGYGIVGLNIVKAAAELGHTIALWFIGSVHAPESAHGVLRAAQRRTQSFNPRAPSLRIDQALDLAQHIGKGLHTALPIFELTRLRDVERHHLLSLDLVFAPTAWAAHVLEDNGIPAERIACAPLAVDTDIFHPGLGTANPTGPTTFLNVGKWEVRKGHDILVGAFHGAFAKTDDVRLIMACDNPFLDEGERGAWIKMYKNSPLGEKIYVLDKRLPRQQDVAALMALADCGVFPARAEGWNLDLAEMLAMGKHVIATNYAAHTEFCSADNAHLITVDRLEDAHDGIWFDATDKEWHGQPGQWAYLGEPQMEQLVEHLRTIHRLKQSGQLRINDAGIRTFRHFTWANTVRAIISSLSCLETLCATV